jgi:hypothetical protein
VTLIVPWLVFPLVLAAVALGCKQPRATPLAGAGISTRCGSGRQRRRFSSMSRSGTTDPSAPASRPLGAAARPKSVTSGWVLHRSPPAGPRETDVLYFAWDRAGLLCERRFDWLEVVRP